MQYSTAHRQAHRSSLKCHHSRVANLTVPYCTVFPRLPEPRQCFIPRAAGEPARRIIRARGHAPDTTIPPRAVISYWVNCHNNLRGCMLPLLRPPGLLQPPRPSDSWSYPASAPVTAVAAASPSRAYPCPTRFLLPPFSRLSSFTSLPLRSDDCLSSQFGIQGCRTPCWGG